MILKRLYIISNLTPFNYQILFLVYVVLIGIMLINLLIAMMANTYDTTTNLKREWLRQVTEDSSFNSSNLILMVYAYTVGQASAYF